MFIRAADGSAIADLTGAAIFTRPGEAPDVWGLFVVPAAGTVVVLVDGSAARVRKAIDAAAEAMSSERARVNPSLMIDLEKLVGPPSDLTVATVMPDLERGS